MGKYNLGASMDIGHDRETQEDYVSFKDLDNDNTIAIIADGAGSVSGYLQPAVIASTYIQNEIQEIFNSDKELLLSNPKFFLERALRNANNILGAYKLGNLEKLSGYAASVTVALFTADNKIHIAHCGNTRFYIMRNSKLIQVTTDQTEGQKLLYENVIDESTYYVHPSRLKITGGLGNISNPDIEVVSGSIYDTDIFLMTTDGIHYAVKPEYITKLVLEGQDTVKACANLIYAAKDVVKYPDNMSAIVICYNR